MRMIVCVCHRVNELAVRDWARRGVTFEDFQMETGVATRCGRCRSCARDIWEAAGGCPLLDSGVHGSAVASIAVSTIV